MTFVFGLERSSGAAYNRVGKASKRAARRALLRDVGTVDHFVDRFNGFRLQCLARNSLVYRAGHARCDEDEPHLAPHGPVVFSRN
jgi:hypothetical protein